MKNEAQKAELFRMKYSHEEIWRMKYKILKLGEYCKKSKNMKNEV